MLWCVAAAYKFNPPCFRDERGRKPLALITQFLYRKLCTHWVMQLFYWFQVPAWGSCLMRHHGSTSPWNTAYIICYHLISYVSQKTINISLLVPIKCQTYIRAYVHTCIFTYVHRYICTSIHTYIQSCEAKYASFINNQHSMVSFPNEKILSDNHGWAVSPRPPKMIWDWLGGNLDIMFQPLNINFLFAQSQ